MPHKKRQKHQREKQKEEISQEIEQEQESSKENISQQEECPLSQCEKERDTYKEKYLRALADYRNFEQRALNEKVETRLIAEMNILERILPFIDNLKRAEVFVKDPGLQMIKKEFERILEEIGVKEIELLNKEFDPMVAEVIEVVEGEKDDIITEVVLSAYGYKDKVLRHGQVKVSKTSQK